MMKLPHFFVSDTHLSLLKTDRAEERMKSLIKFLDMVAEKKGTLFIVGDLFDFYFEYPDVIPKIYFPFYVALNRLKESGVEVHYILGNHDYWVQDFVADKLVTKVHNNDFRYESNGKTFYLTHGDGILSWDHGYRVLKSVIRHPLFIWFYRWLHPTLGYKFARWISYRGKRLHTDEYNLKVKNELKAFARPLISDGVDFVISGHYHQVVNEAVGSGNLAVLGEWITQPSFGYFDGESLTVNDWK